MKNLSIAIKRTNECGKAIKITVQNSSTREYVSLVNENAWKIFNGIEEIYSAFSKIGELYYLPPQQTIEWTWDQKDNNGNQVECGKGYTVKVIAITETASKTFTIQNKEVDEISNEIIEHANPSRVDNVKSAAADVSNVYSKVGAGATIVGAGMAASGALIIPGAIVAGVGLGCLVGGWYMDSLNNEPPDTIDYDKPAIPNKWIKTKIISDSDKKDQNLIYEANLFINTLMESNQTIEAFSKTCERIQGAFIENDENNFTKRITEAKEYAHAINKQLLLISLQIQSLIYELTHSGIDSKSFSVDEKKLKNYYDDKLKNGLSNEEKKIADQLNLSKSMQKQLTVDLLSIQSPYFVGNIIDSLTELQDVTRKKANSFKDFANETDISNFKNPLSPYPYSDMIGYVYDLKTGRGVDDALVCLFPDFLNTKPCVKSKDGFYSMEYILPGCYVATASAANQGYSQCVKKVCFKPGSTRIISFPMSFMGSNISNLINEIGHHLATVGKELKSRELSKTADYYIQYNGQDLNNDMLFLQKTLKEIIKPLKTFNKEGNNEECTNCIKAMDNCNEVLNSLLIAKKYEKYTKDIQKIFEDNLNNIHSTLQLLDQSLLNKTN